jgi:hypothetical protein
VLGHLTPGDLLQDLAQSIRVFEGFPGHLRIDAVLVELVRAEDLDVHLHLAQRLLEGGEEVLGVGDVAALGVGDAREAVPHKLLEALRDAGG